MWWQKARKPETSWPAPVLPRNAAPGFAEAMGAAPDYAREKSRPETAFHSLIPSVPADKPFASEGPQGHRERMRDRLLDRGSEGLADYELLEMILFWVQPKGDTKPLAKRLINRFGSYSKTLAASPLELEAVQGVGRHTVAAMKLVHASAIRLARGELQDQPLLGNWEQLMAYLNAVMARERVEHFRILYLDTKNRLIADELQGRGTINHTPVYPREVARRALELHAASLILAHNHPSGDPTPSMPDLEMTMQIQKMLSGLGIALHDHIIVGNGSWTSLRKEGFL